MLGSVSFTNFVSVPMFQCCVADQKRLAANMFEQAVSCQNSTQWFNVGANGERQPADPLLLQLPPVKISLPPLGLARDKHRPVKPYHEMFLDPAPSTWTFQERLQVKIRPGGLDFN